MSRPLSLRALFALRRGPAAATKPAGPWPPRPAGPLLWVHACDGAAAEGACALADAFRRDGDALTLLLTWAEGAAAPPAVSEAAADIVVPLPDDRSVAARDFVDYWRPDMLVWTGRGLRPRLLDRCRDRSMAMILVDTGQEALIVDPDGPMLPGLSRALLSLFDEVLCIDPASAAQLDRSGLPAGRGRIVSPFEAPPAVLPVADRDREEMADALGTRPVWLSVTPGTPEIDSLASAHREAARRAHRLFLIVATVDTDAVAARLTAAGLDVVDRSRDEPLSFNTDALVADLSELGLWYRLAPMSFAGGTLAGGPVRDPFEAAALGSAVIHGLRTGRWAARFDRLRRAGASVAIPASDDLGAAVTGLLSSDRTARIAHAGWDVVSQGADTFNHLLDRLRDAVDRSGG